MSEAIFYRGCVCGRAVALTVSQVPTGADRALVDGLAFAEFARVAAAETTAAAATAAVRAATICIEVVGRSATGAGQANVAGPDAIGRPLPDPAAARMSAATAGETVLRRDLTPDLTLVVDLFTRRVRFEIALSAAVSEWLPRVRSEILHVLGLFTPALALHASSVLAPHTEKTPPEFGAGRANTTSDAWVFCGASGAGKTTIATRLLDTLPLVDEEIVLVDVASSPPRILNAPAGSTGPLEIAGLFVLKQAPRCSVEAIAGGAFIAKNMTRPFNLDVPQFLEERMEKLAQLVAALRPRELRFNLLAMEVRAALEKS